MLIYLVVNCRFDKVHSIDSSYNLPFAVWDMMPHSGASQIHPHVHTFVDKGQYQGRLQHSNYDYVVTHNYFAW